MSGTRPSHLAKELIALGHRVTVVTVDWSSPDNPRVDAGEAHVLAVDPRGWFPGFDADRAPLKSEAEPTGPALLRKVRTLRRTLRWGPYERWARAALAALEALHERDPLDVLWAIHGDDSAHEIAYRFSRAHKVPWVADFKDPWDLFHHQAPAVRWLQEQVTRRRLGTAKALTETCKAQADADGARFGLPAHVLYTGYDADVMERAVPERARAGDKSEGEPRPRSVFVLGYIGNLSHQHDIDAIARLLQGYAQRKDAPLALELHSYCNDVRALSGMLDKRGVLGMLHVHALVPRERAYGLMKGADALLLLPATHFAPSGGSIGVKELEYLASGAPVLSIGKLLPELGEVARGCPQLIEAADDRAALDWLWEEAKTLATGAPSPTRAEVNRPAVRRHAWPEKGRDLGRILETARRR
ncbi:MAG: glycosyltransferase [Byssovorax sp.]